TECREMAARAPDLRKEVTAPAAIPGQLGRRGVGEEAHEVVGKVELFLPDLGIGGRVDARWNRLSADGLLGGLRRVSDSHLGTERTSVELRQGRDKRLAAAPADPPVQGAVGSPVHAVVLSVF